MPLPKIVTTPDSVPMEQTKPSQHRPRKKQRAGRFPQKLRKEPASKRRRTERTPQSTQPSLIPESAHPPPTESVPATTTTEPRINPNDTSKVQAGQSSVTTIREATAFPEIHLAAHELTTILQFDTSYEWVEWLARRL